MGRYFETTQTSCFSSYFPPTNFSNYELRLAQWYLLDDRFLFPSSLLHLLIGFLLEETELSFLLHSLIYSITYFILWVIIHLHYYFIVQIVPDLATGSSLSWLLGPFTIHCPFLLFSSFSFTPNSSYIFFCLTHTLSSMYLCIY